jgi:hypothetical protein
MDSCPMSKHAGGAGDGAVRRHKSATLKYTTEIARSCFCKNHKCECANVNITTRREDRGTARGALGAMFIATRRYPEN